VLADVAKASLAIEAVRRIDTIFDVEREINGLSATQRHSLRQLRVAPLVMSLEQWMRAERGRLSRHADIAKAMDYMLKRWAAFTRFLADGRICLTNNAAERGLRGIALGRKAWLFAGPDRGGERAAAMYSLIVTALYRTRHSADYAARRTMPNVSGLTHGRRGAVGCSVAVGRVPFGIVSSLRARPGRQVIGRWGGSGFGCRLGTA
jgi:hypothetical protein